MPCDSALREWTKGKNGHRQFRPANGAVLNYWKSTETITFQGRELPAAELKAMVLQRAYRDKDTREQRTRREIGALCLRRLVLCTADYSNFDRCRWFAMNAFNDETPNGQDPAVLARCHL